MQRRQKLTRLGPSDGEMKVDNKTRLRSRKAEHARCCAERFDSFELLVNSQKWTNHS